MRILVFASLFLFYGCIGTDLVDDPVVRERVSISPRPDSLGVGTSQQFQAIYTNRFGVEEAASVQWVSTMPDAITIDANGLAMVLDTGACELVAIANGAVDTLTINDRNAPSNTTRTGTFVNGDGGYFARGSATLEQQPDGSVKLILGSDFATSAGPSLYLFLANKTSGPYSFQQGGNTVNGVSAQLTPNRLTTFSGGMEFTAPAGVQLSDYDYAVLYCILGPVFGYATFN